MITDEEETVAGFNIDLNSDLGFQEDDEDSFMCASNDQPMSYHQDDLMINEGFMNFQSFYLYLYITTYLIYKVCLNLGDLHPLLLTIYFNTLFYCIVINCIFWNYWTIVRSPLTAIHLASE